ncbi:MAG TPA: DUF1330 domain-containing protein [Alphaproteobacteria bacterium]|nr:DUF1330 domain-containing protein [Alphaproteobacteria bacterium]
MAAYVIADIGEIRDQDAYARYRAQVMATIEKHGGRFLVRGGAHETLEGKWRPGRVVIIEFPDMAAAKRWHGSKEYAPLLKLRQSASEGSLVAVEGA